MMLIETGSSMDKEEKVDMLTACLAEVIAERRKAQEDPCAIIFLSADEIQMQETLNGSVPTNKVYSGNPLKTALRTVVKCYYAEEEKHWLEEVATGYPELPDDMEGRYDPALCPGHVYHSLRVLKALVSDD